MKNGETWGHNPDEYEADFKTFSDEDTPKEAASEPAIGLTMESMKAEADEYSGAFDEDAKAEPAGAESPEENLNDFDAKAEKEMEVPMEKKKPSSFKEAFKSARDDGLSEFEWNGKKYTTQLKSDVKAPKATTSEAAPANPAKAETPLGMDKKKADLSLDVPADLTMHSANSKKPAPEAKKMGWNDVKPLAAADDAPSIYGRKPVADPEAVVNERIKKVGTVAMKG
jgi:hypothetical protein